MDSIAGIKEEDVQGMKCSNAHESILDDDGSDPVLRVVKHNESSDDEEAILEPIEDGDSGLALVSQSADSDSQPVDPSLLHVMSGDGQLTEATGPHGLQEAALSAGDGTRMLSTFTLPDGTLALIQESAVPNGMQSIQLVDGSTTFIQSSKPEGYEAIQLADGSTVVVAIQSVSGNEWKEVMDSTSSGAVTQLSESQDPSVSTGDEESGMTSCDESPAFTVASIDLAQNLCSADAPAADSVSSSLNRITADKKLQSNRSVLASPKGNSNAMLNTLTSPTKSPGDKSASLTDKAYRCSFENCGRLYTTMHHLRVHQRSHTGDRPYRCEYANCSKAFATNYGLKSHHRVHTGEKPYKCPDPNCPKAFKTSGDLQKHVRTHTGEKPFKCPFEGCERYFTTSNIRKVHIRTHTGQRPYVCTERGCNKAFSSATNYKNHVRIHTGEKPYVCTVEGCGKRFTEYSSLYKHHVVHTHTKPYICNTCGKMYRQTSTLAMHRRMAHGDEVPTASAETSLISDVSSAAFIPQSNIISGATTNGLTLAKSNSIESIGEDPGGALIISTTDAVNVSKRAEVESSSAVQVLPQVTGLLGSGSGGGITVTPICAELGDQQQQIFVVTDPSRLEMFQQLAQQQQQESTTDKSQEQLQQLLTSSVVTSQELLHTQPSATATSAEQSEFVAVEGLPDLSQ